MIHIVLWAAITLQALTAFLCVGLIGKERKPIEPGTAAVQMVLSGIMITGFAYVLMHY